MKNKLRWLIVTFLTLITITTLIKTITNYHTTLEVKHLPNTFVFDPSTKEIYQIGIDNKKHLLLIDQALASYGLNPDNLKLATKADLRLSRGIDISYREGTILLSQDQYYLIEGKQIVVKRPVSIELLSGLGYQIDRIQQVTPDKLPEATGDPYQLSGLHPEGSLIKSSEATFLIENRQLRRFADQFILDSYLAESDSILPASELDLRLPRGNDMEPRLGSLFRTDNQEYYTLVKEDGYIKKKAFSSPTTYRGLGYTPEEASLVDITQLPIENTQPIIYSYLGKSKLAPVAILEKESNQLYDASASIDDQGIDRYYWQVNQSLDWLEGNILNLTGDQDPTTIRLIVVDKNGLVDSKILGL
ncbi:hypothetical protein KA531_03540 [Candidatus Saccharibacteria bacterium]|nr:hypothetical protein [Candidatus Saccharibacteria bacterium]